VPPGRPGRRHMRFRLQTEKVQVRQSMAKKVEHAAVWQQQKARITAQKKGEQRHAAFRRRYIRCRQVAEEYGRLNGARCRPVSPVYGRLPARQAARHRHQRFTSPQSASRLPARHAAQQPKQNAISQNTLPDGKRPRACQQPSSMHIYRHRMPRILRAKAHLLHRPSRLEDAVYQILRRAEQQSPRRLCREGGRDPAGISAAAADSAVCMPRPNMRHRREAVEPHRASHIECHRSRDRSLSSLL